MVAANLALPVAQALLPAVQGAIAGATGAAAGAAAAALPMVAGPIAGAAIVPIIAAGMAAADWQQAGAAAAKAAAQARYCSAAIGRMGCPAFGMWELTIEIRDMNGEYGNVKMTTQAPFYIGVGAPTGYPAFLLFGAGLSVGGTVIVYMNETWNYGDHHHMPEIVRFKPVQTEPYGPEIPWESLTPEVRAEAAPLVTPRDIAPVLVGAPTIIVEPGTTVPPGSVIASPDGTVAPAQPGIVRNPTAEAPPHPYAGPAPVAAPGVGAPAQAPTAPIAPTYPGTSAGAAAPAAGAGVAASPAAASPASGAGRVPAVGVGAAGTAPVSGAGATRAYSSPGAIALPSGGVALPTPTAQSPAANLPVAGASAVPIGAAIGAIPAAIGAVMTPALAQIPNAAQVTTAAATGACQAMNGQGGCSSNPIGRLQQGMNSIQDKLAGLDTLGNAAILARLAALEAALGGAIKKVGDAVNSDRALAIMTYMNTLHNAYFLSSNLSQTLFSLTSNSLNLILQVAGFKSATDESIDVGAQIGGVIDNTAKQIFGVQTWTGIKREWAAWSRVYQASANMLWTVTGMFDSARTIADWTAENTGKIGNALKKWGVVGENAYKWMPERMNSGSIHQKQWDRVIEGVAGIEEAASSLDMIVSSTTSIVDGFTQLGESRKAAEQAWKEALPKDHPENSPIKTAADASKTASAGATVTDADESKPGA